MCIVLHVTCLTEQMAVQYIDPVFYLSFIQSQSQGCSFSLANEHDECLIPPMIF